MGLEEEFNAYLKTKEESGQYKLERDFATYLQDMAQGGSIRQAPREKNFPYGAAIGGAIGVAAPIMAGQPELAPVTGPLFSAAGEAGQQQIERLLGSSAAPQSPGEATQRIVEEGAYGLAGGQTGRIGHDVAAPLGRKLLRSPIASNVTPQGQAAEKFLQPYTSHAYLPSEITSHWGLDIMQNVAENSMLGGSAIRHFKQQRFDEVFQKVADEMVDQFGPRMNPADTGRAVVDAVKHGKELAGVPSSMIYNSIEKAAAPTYTPKLVGLKGQGTIGEKMLELKTGEQITKDVSEIEPSLRGIQTKTSFQDVQVGTRLEHLKIMTSMEERITNGARIDLRDLKDEIAGMAEIAKKAGGLEKKAMGTTLLQYIEAKPDIVSYPVAKQIRTEIRTFRDAMKGSMEYKNAPGIGKANVIYGKLTNSIRDGLRDYDPFLSQMWDEANFIEKAGHLQFSNKLVRSIITKAVDEGGGKPEAIADAVFKRNNYTVIANLKNAVDPPTWQKMQSIGMQNIISHWQKEGEITPAGLREAAFGRSGLGIREFTLAFGPDTTRKMAQFVNALAQAEAKPQAPGSMLIQMKQSGAVMEVAGSVMATLGLSSGSDAMSAAGVTILLGPEVMSKLLTNKTASDWLIHGVAAPKYSKEAAQLAGQILAFAFPRPSERRTPTQPMRPTGVAQPMRPFALQQ